MKAIDFACRFLTRVQKDDLSPAARLVLVAVAAGLEDKLDIGRETSLSLSVCTTQLRLLEKLGEVRCISPLSERYVLAPALYQILDLQKYALDTLYYELLQNTSPDPK